MHAYIIFFVDFRSIHVREQTYIWKQRVEVYLHERCIAHSTEFKEQCSPRVRGPCRTHLTKCSTVQHTLPILYIVSQNSPHKVQHSTTHTTHALQGFAELVSQSTAQYNTHYAVLFFISQQRVSKWFTKKAKKSC